jgi:hypothetical protein
LVRKIEVVCSLGSSRRRPYLLRAMKIPLVLVALLCPMLASAAMRLDGDHVDVKPKPEDEIASVVFNFKNDGDKPVRILHLESACSCLSATLDKPVYEPGEKGTGTAQFKVSSFTGEQEKIITVTTDDPKQTEWIVPFIVTVPAVVEIEPKNVQWWLNEEPKPKDMIVKMVGESEMKLTNITSTRENMGFTFKEVKPGREYRVTLTPKTTNEIMIGALKLETDSKIPKYQRQLAFFSIVRQPESRKAEDTAGPAPVLQSKPGATPPPVKSGPAADEGKAEIKKAEPVNTEKPKTKSKKK